VLLRLAQRIRVPAGFILAPLMFVAARPTRVSVGAGSLVALAGLAIRAWASGCLKKNEELATSGPYAYTRNPLYLGTLLLGLGISVCTGSWWFACIFVLFYLVIYLPVMIAEAETLRKLFPDQYPSYSDRVPLLVPSFRSFDAAVLTTAGTANKPHAGAGFDLSLYIRHREYRAFLGFVALLAILIIKAWLTS
jgi:hypothetical protein